MEFCEETYDLATATTHCDSTSVLYSPHQTVALKSSLGDQIEGDQGKETMNIALSVLCFNVPT